MVTLKAIDGGQGAGRDGVGDGERHGREDRDVLNDPVVLEKLERRGPLLRVEDEHVGHLACVHPRNTARGGERSLCAGNQPTCEMVVRKTAKFEISSGVQI